MKTPLQIPQYLVLDSEDQRPKVSSSLNLTDISISQPLRVHRWEYCKQEGEDHHNHV